MRTYALCIFQTLPQRPYHLPPDMTIPDCHHIVTFSPQKKWLSTTFSPAPQAGRRHTCSAATPEGAQRTQCTTSVARYCQTGWSAER